MKISFSYSSKNKTCYFVFRALALGIAFQSWGTYLYAQETKLIRKRVSPSLTETYFVNKDQKKIRNGWCMVKDEDGNILAKGLYKNGIKDSIWTYYNSFGKKIQEYDFTHHQLLFNIVDSTTIVHSEYQLLEFADSSDKVEPPLKIGGLNYGFYLLYDERKVPAEVKGSSSNIQLSYVFTISEKGKLEKWISIYAGNKIKDIVIPQSIKNLPQDAYEFIPAQLNGKYVRSKLSYVIAISVNSVQVPGTNNIITPPKK